MSFPSLNAYATNSWASLKRYDAFVKGKAENAIITLNGAAQGDNSGLKAEKGDAFRGASWLGRNLWGGAATSANNNVRNDFLQSVLDAFGVKDAQKLPESVRTALEMKNFDGKGHPLTTRRITAVLKSANAERANAYNMALGALWELAKSDKVLADELIAELNTCSVACLKKLADIGKMKARIGNAVAELKLPSAKAELCERYALWMLAQEGDDQWENLDDSLFKQIGGLDERALEFLMKQKIDLRQIAFGATSRYGAAMGREYAAPALGRLIVQTLGDGKDADLRTAYEKLCGMCKQPPGNPSDVKSAYMELLGRMVDGIETFDGEKLVEEQLGEDVCTSVKHCRTLLKGLYNTSVELADNFLQQAQNLTKVVDKCVERIVNDQEGVDRGKARIEVLNQLNHIALNTVEDQKRCLGLLAKVGENGNEDIQTFVDRITAAAKHHLKMNQAVEDKDKELNALLGRTKGSDMIHAGSLGCYMRFKGYPLMDFDKRLDFQDLSTGFNKYVRKSLGAFESVITSYKNICSKIDAMPDVDDDFKSGLKARVASYGTSMEQVEAILTNDKFWGLVKVVMDKDSDLAKAVREYSLQDERGSMTRIVSAALGLRRKCREVCEEIGQEISKNVKVKNGEGVIDFRTFEQFFNFAVENAGVKHKSSESITGNVNFNMEMTNEILKNQVRKNANLLHRSDQQMEVDFLVPEIASGIIGSFFNRK